MGQSIFDALTGTSTRHRLCPVPEVAGPVESNDQPFDYLPWEANSESGGRFVTRQRSTGRSNWRLQNSFRILKAKRPIGRRYQRPAARPTLGSSRHPRERAMAHRSHRQQRTVQRPRPGAQDHVSTPNSPPPIRIAILRTAAYDALDDNSVEAFRRHFLNQTFGVPSPYPPSNPPLGTPIPSWERNSTNDSTRCGAASRTGSARRARNRRRPDGLPPRGRSTLADETWAAHQPANHRLDYTRHDVTLYPDAARDNSGTSVGLFDTIPLARRRPPDDVSSGIFDFFDDGQKIATVGGFLSRPPARQASTPGFT